jgi:hypothetical protein
VGKIKYPIFNTLYETPNIEGTRAIFLRRCEDPV